MANGNEGLLSIKNSNSEYFATALFDFLSHVNDSFPVRTNIDSIILDPHRFVRFYVDREFLIPARDGEEAYAIDFEPHVAKVKKSIKTFIKCFEPMQRECEVRSATLDWLLETKLITSTSNERVGETIYTKLYAMGEDGYETPLKNAWGANSIFFDVRTLKNARLTQAGYATLQVMTAGEGESLADYLKKNAQKGAEAYADEIRKGLLEKFTKASLAGLFTAANGLLSM
ncbi:MAG: hypothetical protein AAFU41_19095 [Pseudomonadota bacterium]